jgi:tetratricopeptide (TPR) repeat protein
MSYGIKSISSILRRAPMEAVGKLLENILAHYEKKEYAAAEKLVNDLIEIDPNFHRAWFLKGIIFEETGRSDKAQEYFAKSGNVFTLMFRLALQLQDSDPLRALTYFDRLAEMDPQNNMLWFNRGLVYEKLGNRNEAAASFKHVAPGREILSRIVVPLLFMFFLTGGGIMMFLRGDKTLSSLVIASAVFCLFWLKRDMGKALQMFSKKKQYK